jgi:hypothetical protein
MSDQNTSGAGGGSESGITRRGLLKALVSVPVLGVFAYSYLRKRAKDEARRKAILDELKVSESGPAVTP